MTKEEKEKILQEMEHLTGGELSADMYYNDGLLQGVESCKNIINKMPITEPKETNLEHYKDDLMRIAEDCEEYDEGIIGWVKFAMERGMDRHSSNRMVELVNWMLSTYKPRYKLSRFEYDLLRTNNMPHYRAIGSYATYVNMRNVGYFKNIDFNLTIDDVLNNCEVVE